MIPKIRIEYDLEKETATFYNFLHSSKFPQQGKLIYCAFPELEVVLNDGNKNEAEEKLAIKTFIQKFREDHGQEIDQTMQINGSLLEAKNESALKKLAELMDYRWTEDHPGYAAIPTILPFCPFGKNLFYFSILNAGNHDIIFVATHEISHMLFYEIMEKIYGKPAEEVLGWAGAHFLKEILAPVLMNQEEFKKILESQDSYGNSFLKHIYVESNDQVMQITKFFQDLYENLKHEKRLRFSEILKIMVQTISSIAEEIESKNQLWNQYGSKIAKDEEKFNAYKKPIKIRPGV